MFRKSSESCTYVTFIRHLFVIITFLNSLQSYIFFSLYTNIFPEYFTTTIIIIWFSVLKNLSYNHCAVEAGSSFDYCATLLNCFTVFIQNKRNIAGIIEQNQQINAIEIEI